MPTSASMSRLASRAALCAYALYGWAIAGWSVLFGVPTCEDGCGGAGPAWTLSHHSAECGYYWK
jgi:hypothetical protein